MRKSIATSIVFGTLLLTGCAISDGKTKVNVENQTLVKEYEVSQKFMMNHVEYKDLNQYKKQRQKMISQEIETFVLNEGYSEDGYNSEGYDRRGFNRNYVNKEGFLEDGFNLNNINEEGFDREGKPSSFTSPYDKFGYDQEGFNSIGLDREGFNAEGYNQDGFNRLGEYEDENELSMNEYIKRSWSEISAKEIFEKDMYLPSVNKLMKTNKELNDQYFAQGMHPFSEQAYNLNLLCNNTPIMMDTLLQSIRVDAMSHLLIDKQQYHDEKILLKSATGEFLQLVNDEQFLSQRFEKDWKSLNALEVGEYIALEDHDGYVINFEMISKERLSDKEQAYIDFARLAMKDSKGKWASTIVDFDTYIYKSLDHLNKNIQLNDAILNELIDGSKKQWPKNYLSDSNEEIEAFNNDMRETFIERILLDLEGFGQLEVSK